jgi:hypothetical protein
MEAPCDARRVNESNEAAVPCDLSLRKSAGRRRMEAMSKALVLLLSLSITVGLLYSFGLVALVVCFGLALATLVFSTGDDQGRMAEPKVRFEQTTMTGSL